MQYKRPFYKKMCFCFAIIFISFFTSFISGNTGMQDSQQTVIAKSTKVVKINAKKVTAKRKQKKRKGVVKRNIRKVYIAPNSGRRYHFNPSCRGLRRAHGNITKISLKKAINQGYTLCKWED